MHSINDSDERAHTLWRYLNDRSANERNVDIQCYVFNNDRQAMYHHYQRHLHYNCYRHDVYDALGYSEAISNQVKMMVNSSPLIQGKYDYSKERKGVYVIFIYNTKIFTSFDFR